MAKIDHFLALLYPAGMKKLFTVETARAAGLKSVRVRAERKAALALAPFNSPVQTEAQPDLFAVTLAQACNETLERLRLSKVPLERAQLARALRDLRETWHLATGKPKPGQLKPAEQRLTRREIPRVLYPVCNGETPLTIKPLDSEACKG